MYTDRWICGTIFTASTIYAHVPASILRNSKHRSDCIRSKARKRQAKQPRLDAEGATESNRCSSSLRMDDIHVGPYVTKVATLHDSSNDSDSNSSLRQWRGSFESN